MDPDQPAARTKASEISPDDIRRGWRNVAFGWVFDKFQSNDAAAIADYCRKADALIDFIDCPAIWTGEILFGSDLRAAALHFFALRGADFENTKDLLAGVQQVVDYIETGVIPSETALALSASYPPHPTAGAAASSYTADQPGAAVVRGQYPPAHQQSYQGPDHSSATPVSGFSAETVADPAAGATTLAAGEVLSAVRAIRAAFGAPGDFGYETPKGQALFELYRTAAALSVAPGPINAARECPAS